MIRLCRCGHSKRFHQQWAWGGYLRCTECLCSRWRWLPAVLRWLLAGVQRPSGGMETPDGFGVSADFLLVPTASAVRRLMVPRS